MGVANLRAYRDYEAERRLDEGKRLDDLWADVRNKRSVAPPYDCPTRELCTGNSTTATAEDHARAAVSHSVLATRDLSSDEYEPDESDFEDLSDDEKEE